MCECTFYKTGKSYETQLIGQCFDCFTEKNHAICFNCLQKCHNGHHISNIRTANAFCDCVESDKCKCRQKSFPTDDSWFPKTDDITDDYEFRPVKHASKTSIYPDPSQPFQDKSGHTSLDDFFKPLINPNLQPHNLIPEHISRGHMTTHDFNPIVHDEFFVDQSYNSSKLSKPILDLGLKCLRLNEGTVLSPYSILTALSLIHGGSKGKTEEEFRKVIPYKPEQYFDDIVKTFYSINKSNSCKTCNLVLSTAGIIIDSYRQKLKNIASFYGLGDVSSVNSYVSNFTNNLIPEVLTPDMLSDPNLRVILINVIYFKSLWKHQFEKSMTRPDTFYGKKNQTIKFMNQYGTRFNYLDDQTNQMIELDYKDDKFSFGMILPHNKNTIPNVSPEQLQECTRKLFSTEIAKLKMPKFTFKNKMLYNKILQQLGLNNMFQVGANFTLMSSDPSLYVDKVFHEIVMIVDEEGTEAAATTSITCNTLGCSSEPDYEVYFIADHPFMYYIRYKPLNLILFMGIFQ